MDIFISYSRHDKEIVFPFVKRIEQELNTTCWIDYEGIESGAQFEEVIVNAIEASKVVLFMLSDNSLASSWTKREVFYAEDEGKRIVPIVADGKGLRKWFKFHFGNIDYIDINDAEQCNKLFNNLATWVGIERATQKTQVLGINSQFEISADRTVITLSIPGGFDLILKKNIESNTYVGEIPVQNIASLVRNKMGVLNGSRIGALASISSTPLNMWGLTGALAGRLFGETLCDRINKMKEETFHTIVSEFNRKYRINLKKRNNNPLDFSVEMDASEISNFETLINMYDDVRKKCKQNPKIFICYKRDNKDIVLQIKSMIEQNTGEICWIDMDGIESDSQFINVVIKAINNAEIFLFMYSSLHTQIEDFENDWTVREISYAQKRKKRIVFINLDDSELTDWFEMMFGTKQQVSLASDIGMNKLFNDIQRWLKSK